MVRPVGLTGTKCRADQQGVARLFLVRVIDSRANKIFGQNKTEVILFNLIGISKTTEKTSPLSRRFLRSLCNWR